MSSTTLSKAKQTVTSTIAEKLFEVVGRSWGKPLTKGAASSLIGQMSKDILEGLLTSPESTIALVELLEKRSKASSKAGTSPAVAQEEDDWLTTERAAARIGFSRPYLIALFDAGEFGKAVAKSDKGHRRVRASAIDKWLEEHAPTRQQNSAALDDADMAEFLELPPAELSSIDLNALDRIEAHRAESLAYRPKHKSA